VLLRVSPTVLLAINLFTPIMYIMKFNLTLPSYFSFVFKIVNLLRSELKQHVKTRLEHGDFTGSEVTQA